MKLLYQRKDANKPMLLEHYVNRDVCGDYIYDYPPRQAYRRIQPDVALAEVKRSLSMSDELNLYYHFPFCKQICSYCNLFAICESNMDHIAKYFEALKKETLFYLPYIKEKKINTLYMGGGTPSLIKAELFADFLDFLQKKIGFDIKTVSEVAMEMSPDTATAEHLTALKACGINRVNIGVQAVDNSELHCIGRKYDKHLVFEALKTVMNAGFKNVCVDLIYGLENQSMVSWETSVQEIVKYAPPTICAYPLTLRSNTGFARKGYKSIDGAEQYKKYCYARDYLLSHGYIQETHVRYKKEGSFGGYIQKQNHWDQQNILGMGAGARSYLKTINTRNGYSVINRTGAYKRYLEDIAANSFAITDGYIMTDDEMMRKQLVLGLDGINLARFFDQNGVHFADRFPAEYNHLLKEGYLHERNGCLFLTEKGNQYRDLIVQMFFSEAVLKAISSYTYDE